MADLPKLSELPGIIKSHPMGLLYGIIAFALILIFQGVFGCLIRLFWRLPFNLMTPDRILADGICDPNRMFKVRIAEWILNFFQHQWFVWFVIIVGFGIFLYYKLKD